MSILLTTCTSHPLSKSASDLKGTITRRVVEHRPGTAKRYGHGVAHVLLRCRFSLRPVPHILSASQLPISRELLLVELLNIDQAPQKDTVMEWPMFSYDVDSPYDLYLTSSQQVSFRSQGNYYSSSC